jgi:hypothetical protein
MMIGLFQNEKGYGKKARYDLPRTLTRKQCVIIVLVILSACTYVVAPLISTTLPLSTTDRL